MNDEIYYDPFDFEIDKNPHAVWKRMRDEAPLWYNDRHDFWALSRYHDVERGLVNWDTFRSGKGSTLEIIRSGYQMPSGMILMDDPPRHDALRGIASRIFTPKKMDALEGKVREFTRRCLDPHTGTGTVDLILDLGALMPMRTIGMLLGIPDEQMDEIRSKGDGGLHLEEDGTVHVIDLATAGAAFAEYIRFRMQHPGDDVVTELLHAEFIDETGTTRSMTFDEVSIFVMLLAGAGSETTTRLIGWSGTLLAQHPDQRRRLSEDRSLIPQAIEEILRYEAPSPVQARVLEHDVEYYGRKVEAGNVMLLLNGSANRDDREYADADRFDIQRPARRHLSFGYGIHFCLGAALARLEGRVALDEVLTRFPDWEVDWHNAVQAHTPTVRGWDRLPVVSAR